MFVAGNTEAEAESGSGVDPQALRELRDPALDFVACASVENEIAPKRIRYVTMLHRCAGVRNRLPGHVD
jgi:hypothetical protein